jgi:hypothetical protein
LLALRWGGLDLNKGTMRISGGLVEASGKPIWTEGKNERSRRTILLDGDTLRALKTHRAVQLHERLAAGSDWIDDDLIISTTPAIACRQAISIKPSADWLPPLEFLGSLPTAYVIQPQRTWSAKPPTSVSYVPSPTFLATRLTC